MFPNPPAGNGFHLFPLLFFISRTRPSCPPPPPALHSFVGLRPLLTHFHSPLLPYIANSTRTPPSTHPPSPPHTHAHTPGTPAPTTRRSSSSGGPLSAWRSRYGRRHPLHPQPLVYFFLLFRHTAPSHDALSCTPWKCLAPGMPAELAPPLVPAPRRSTCSPGCSNPTRSAPLDPLHSLHRSTLSTAPLATPTRYTHSLHPLAPLAPPIHAVEA